MSNIEQKLTTFEWLIKGNVVVQTGNPFDVKHLTRSHLEKDNDDDDDDDDEKDANNDDSWSLKVGPGLSVKRSHIVAVTKEGLIDRVDTTESFCSEFGEHRIRAHEGFIELDDDNEFLCPGMIDLHIHAPQFAFSGTATDRPLMGSTGWLESYTFPTEERLRDLTLAAKVYKNVVMTTLRNGTTTALYFATLDLEPTKLLVDTALQCGQRALVGKVCMDRNSPESYCHTVEENLQDTEAIIRYIRSHPLQRYDVRAAHLPFVFPVVTPRFIPTCSAKLLGGLGKIAKEFNCHVTSHISESKDEVAFSRQLDIIDHGITPEGRSDAEIFDSHGLLTSKCVMAHGIYLSDGDLDLMKDRKSAIAHCPLSNFFFADGCMASRKYVERGTLVGLGTDVAGGYSCSMLNAGRNAVIASLALQQQQPDERHKLDFVDAFYLSTVGGAQALGLEDKLGTLKVGMVFDAFVLSSTRDNLFISGNENLADIFQKLFNLGDDRNISRVFVHGKKVIDKTNKEGNGYS